VSAPQQREGALGPGAPGTDGLPAPEIMKRVPWSAITAAILVAVGAASVAFYAILGADQWFASDHWDFVVNREIGSLDSWLGPHSGHLQWPAVLLHRLLYGAVGLDFWPWYLLPHLIGYAALVLYLWRMLIWRGLSRTGAFLTTLVLFALGLAWVIRSIMIGTLIALAALVFIARRLDAVERPCPRDQVSVSGALLLAVSATSLGVAAFAATLAVVVSVRSLRRWWPSLLLPGVAYAAWYLAYAGGPGRAELHLDRVLLLPWRAAELLGSSAARLLGLPTGIAVAYGFLLFAGVAWLMWRRRLRRFDWVLLLTLAAFLAMVVMVRTGFDQARYDFNPAVIVVLLAAPHLDALGRDRPPARYALIAAVVIWLIPYNAWARAEGIEFREGHETVIRERLESLAAMIADGEPTLDDLRTDRDLAIPYTRLTVADVRDLVAGWWSPPPGDGAVSSELRPLLRMEVRYGADRAGAAEGDPLAVEGVRDCLVLPPGQTLQTDVVTGGTITLTPSLRNQGGVAELEWHDRFAVTTHTLEMDRRAVVDLAPPTSPTRLVIHSDRAADIEICGFAGP